MPELDGVDVTVGIVDGRVAMNAEGEADLYVDGRDHTPLSLDEPHVTLRLAGDDYRAAVDLDGRDLDALVDELHHLQERYHDAE